MHSYPRIRQIPIIAALLLLAIPTVRAQEADGRWSALDANAAFDGEVLALAEDESGHLYVGGTFEHIRGAPVGSIASWDGSAWHALGVGLDNGPFDRTKVYSIAIAAGTLYVGGEFRSAGGITAHGIASWDGNQWGALGDGLASGGYRSVVHAIIPDGFGGIYVGGRFETAGGLHSQSVAHWDGHQWTGLGGGVSGVVVFDRVEDDVYALALDSRGYLYAAGSFSKAGGIDARRVAMWDGHSWNALAEGLGGSINGVAPSVVSLAHDGTYLYASGTFSEAGGHNTRNIARWDGSLWVPLNEGLCDEYAIERLVIFQGAVYASSTVECEAEPGDRRQGVKRSELGWKQMGTGVRGIVSAFAPGENRLYVGSAATFTAGGDAASGVAVWRVESSSHRDTGDAATPDGINLRLGPAYPNPFGEATTIVVEAGRDGKLILTGSDMIGRVVLNRLLSVTRGQSTVRWQPEGGLPAGHYLITVQSVPAISRAGSAGLVLTKL